MVIFIIYRKKFTLVSHKVIPDSSRTIPCIQKVHFLTESISCSIHINLIAVYSGILSPAVYNIILFKCTLNCCTAISITNIISYHTVISLDIYEAFCKIFTAHSCSVKCTVFYSCPDCVFFYVNVFSSNIRTKFTVSDCIVMTIMTIT